MAALVYFVIHFLFFWTIRENMAIIWANGLCISLNLALVFLTVISLLASWSVYFCFSPLYQPSPVLELQLAMMMLVLYWRWAANLTGTLTKSCNRWRATAAKMLNSPRLQNSDDSHQLQNYPNTGWESSWRGSWLLSITCILKQNSTNR